MRTTALSTISTATAAATTWAADPDEPLPPQPALLTPTVRLAAHMAGTAYHEAGRRVQRLARQLLPQAACPDDRMRLLFLYAAEENYLASVFPAAKPAHPERWQAGVAEHQLTGDLAGLIATAEEAIATGTSWRPGMVVPDTAITDLMACYVTDRDPVGRAGLLDRLAAHLRALGYPARAVDLVTDVAAGLRVTAINGHRHPSLPAA